MLLATIIGVGQARPHEGHHTNVNAGPEIKRWIEGLTDKKGRGCCSSADGFPAEVEWDIEGNHYKVLIEGKWHVVPDDALLTQPNRIGYAMVWYFTDNGIVTIRCFIPGTEV